MRAGDIILGLASSGPHANGFSLIRKVLEQSGASLSDELPGTRGTLGDALLAPTRIYVNAMLRLFAEVEVSAVAHITGGGLPGESAARAAAGRGCRIDRASWQIPEVFGWLQRQGNIEDAECCAHLTAASACSAVVPQRDAARAAAILEEAGETVFSLGRIAVARRRVAAAAGGVGVTRAVAVANPLNLVVLISGNGSNLQAILDGAANGELPARVCAVISDAPTHTD